MAVLAIEDDSDVYPHFHRSTDLPEHLSLEMAEQILRMTVGYLALSAGTAELSGCVEVDDEPLEGVEVLLSQAREPKRTTRSDQGGCFAFDDLVAGKKFRIQVRGPGLTSAVSRLSAWSKNTA